MDNRKGILAGINEHIKVDCVIKTKRSKAWLKKKGK